jgi:hypothetical protein
MESDNAEKIDSNNNTEIRLGDLVCLKSNPYEIKEIIKKDKTNLGFKITGSFFSLSPFMVVIEIIREKNKQIFDQSTGNQIADEIKYKCQWYSHIEGSFKEQFFYKSLLKQLSEDELKLLNIVPTDNKEFIYGANVILRTNLLESKKYVSSHYKVNFTPPTMTITTIQNDNAQSNLYHPYKKDGNGKAVLLKDISTKKIKCMWYNPFTNKFCEQFFIEEALIQI